VQVTIVVARAPCPPLPNPRAFGAARIDPRRARWASVTSRLEPELFNEALLDLRPCQYDKPATIAESTHSLPLPFNLHIDDGTPCLFLADQIKCVLIRLQRARRAERVTPL
jgi:hypothetical protein